MATPRPLAHIDTHARMLAAPPGRVWEALARVLPRATEPAVMRRYARFVRSDPPRSEGAFPQEGSAMPGFRVVRAAAPRALVLAGCHRFARYELDVRLEPLDEERATRLSARTRAAFPGAGGAAYRLVVIGTGGHALAMKALLARVAREAERSRR